jgi:hypothetical protein
VVASLVIALGAGCERQAKPAPNDQSRSGLTDQGRLWVELVPVPNPIPFNKIFEMKVVVRDAAKRDQPAQGVSLDDVRITMPAHGHGMKVKHEILDGAQPGEFLLKGLQFHMNGEGDNGLWAVELILQAQGQIDRVSFDLQCCID